METLTFEKIPEAISAIDRKLDAILAFQKNSEEPDMDRLMTIAQLAKYLPEKPARQTVYGWTNARKVPYEKHGKNLYFRKSEIDKWLRNGRQMKL